MTGLKGSNIEKLERLGEEYERGKMLRPDSEVEIDIVDNEVYLCDYSEIRESAEQVAKICDLKDIDIDDITRVCDEHHWSICL